MDAAYLTISEAAKRYRLSRNTLRALMDDGYISGFRTEGGHRRISVASADEWTERGEARAAEIADSIVW